MTFDRCAFEIRKWATACFNVITGVWFFVSIIPSLRFLPV
jgi:hypothetical protein